MINIPNTPIPHNNDDGKEVAVTETEREIWKECIKMYVKDERQIQDHLKKMYYKIWGHVSDELCATVKIISGFSIAADKFDAIGLIKIIQKAMFNVQIQNYFPAAVHMVKRSCYNRLQEKGSTVQEYYEKFKKIWKWWNNLAFL